MPRKGRVFFLASGRDSSGTRPPSHLVATKIMGFDPVISLWTVRISCSPDGQVTCLIDNKGQLHQSTTGGEGQKSFRRL